MRKIKYLLVSIMLLLFSVGCNNKNITANIKNVSNSSNHETIKIHYIDVGQGDSTFIELPNSETMLIDTGEREYYSILDNYINKLGYKKIDYVIGTHPHTDHIGSLEYIIKNYDVKNIYLPKVTNNTQTFLKLLQAINKKNLKINTGKSGIKIIDNDDLIIKIIAPNSDNYEELNNYSVVIKITYKNKNFLFMGDAEVLSENEIVDDVKADVIKVGHHGSTTSSSNKFINKVNPEYAIISVGKDNKYNHPHNEIIDKFNRINTKIYRTDINGTIVIESDGENISINNQISNDSTNKNEDLKVIYFTDNVIKGNTAQIELKGKKNTNYDIKVKYKSGYSKASGLESKTSDENGIIKFEWKVSKSVQEGKYPIIINDNEKEYIYYFNVIKEE